MRLALVPTALALLIALSSMGALASETAPDRTAFIDPRLEALGLDTPEKIELLSTVRLQTYIFSGLYRPAAGSPAWDLVAQPTLIEAPRAPSQMLRATAPPFEANVPVSDVLKDKQNEISMDSDINGNLYAGWNDNRLFDPAGGMQADYRCGYSGSKDGGKTWSANELYKGPFPEGGDAVVVAHGNVFWRVCMSFDRAGGTGADIMISKSTDGATTWGPWIDATAGQTQSTNDKEWMDFDGTHLYIAVYDSGPINFWKSDDDGATWKSKKNLGSGQGNCILAGNNGVVLVGWGSSSRIMRSTDYGVNFVQVKSGFVSGGGGSNPRSSPLLMCAKDSARQHMYYAFAASSGGTETVQVLHSADEGATWGSPVAVAPGSTRQIMPGVDVSGDGVVHVGWTEIISGNIHTFYSNSTDLGATWSPKVEISDGTGGMWASPFIGDYQQLDAAVTNRIGYVWCDTRSGTTNLGDVYFGGYDYKKGGGGGGNGSIARVEVTPPTVTITADQTQQFVAKAFDANNQQVNTTFTWTASGGSIDQNGLYTPQSTGSFAIAALASGKSGTASVTVNHGVLVSLEVSPQNPTVKADATQQFLLDGKDAKGNAWSIGNATWGVTGGAGAGNIDPTGVYAPDKLGTYTVEGTDPGSGMKASTQVTVVAGAPKNVIVEPPTATITADQTQQYTAKVQDSRGNPVTASITWIPQDGNMDQSTGVFTPFRLGTWEIGAQASAAGASAYGKASVTVTVGALASLEVTPDKKTITADETQQFAAKGFDAKGNEIASLPALTWSADKGTVDGAGLYSPDKAGAVKVSAAAGSVSGGATLTVVAGSAASLKIDPAEISIDKGQNVLFRLSAADAKGNVIAVKAENATWSVVGEAIGNVDKSGFFVGRDAGETVVRASLDGKDADAKVLVRGGLFDVKGGGQLPMILGLLVAVIALVAVAAILSRKKKKAREQAMAQQTFQQVAYSDPASGQQWVNQPQEWPPQGYDQPQAPPGEGGWPPQGPQ